MKITCIKCNKQNTENTYRSRVQKPTSISIRVIYDMYYCRNCDDYFEVEFTGFK